MWNPRRTIHIRGRWSIWPIANNKLAPLEKWMLLGYFTPELPQFFALQRRPSSSCVHRTGEWGDSGVLVEGLWHVVRASYSVRMWRASASGYDTTRCYDNFLEVIHSSAHRLRTPKLVSENLQATNKANGLFGFRPSHSFSHSFPFYLSAGCPLAGWSKKAGELDKCLELKLWKLNMSPMCSPESFGKAETMSIRGRVLHAVILSAQTDPY